jgi:hypothetical protein
MLSYFVTAVGGGLTAAAATVMLRTFRPAAFESRELRGVLKAIPVIVDQRAASILEKEERDFAAAQELIEGVESRMEQRLAGLATQEGVTKAFEVLKAAYGGREDGVGAKELQDSLESLASQMAQAVANLAGQIQQVGLDVSTVAARQEQLEEDFYESGPDTGDGEPEPVPAPAPPAVDRETAAVARNPLNARIDPAASFPAPSPIRFAEPGSVSERVAAMRARNARTRA